MSLFLNKGQNSNDVVGLQYALNAALDGTEPLVLDGMFGPRTEKATREVQRREGLTVDGIAGPRTLGALFEGVAVSATLGIIPLIQKPSGATSAKAAAPSLSFGAIGLYSRELQVGNWLGGGFPKPPLSVFARLPTPPPLDLLTLRRRGTLVQRLILPKKPVSIERSSEGGTDFAFEGEISTTTSDLTEVEYEFQFTAIQPRRNGFFKPSVSLIPSPVGALTATTKVKTRTLAFIDLDWRRWSAEVKGGLAASLTTPLVLGAEAGSPQHKGKLDATVSADVTWRPIDRRRDFELFFGGQLGVSGFVKFQDGKIEGGYVAPAFKINGGVRLKFKLW